MDLVIIKYNAGNIQSVLYALERIGLTAEVTDDHERIKRADKVIFPGVGEARSAMNYLKSRLLDQVIVGLRQPVLGICLGMQLMCSYSEENDTECLGIFNEKVKLFRPLESEGLASLPGISQGTDQAQGIPPNNTRQSFPKARFKVPQIGWNTIYDLKTKLFDQIPENSYCYFVHGYFAALGAQTVATSNYIQPYSAALRRDNFYGTQFHPEKSAGVGEQILRNFLSDKL